MNISPRTTETSVRQAVTVERPPLKKIRCLVPVWGYAYIRNFLEVGLPSWLADGNLPAISRMVPTEFVLLTSREDETYLRAHPAFKRLSAICETTIYFIDHLITGTNYSTTITLAYLEAVRATGDEMLDTCFLFLVSDYIVADGSFRTVVERIQAGRNGVLVGNFQVVEEEALPWLRDILLTNPNVLEVRPRELMKWALSHLHPATVANTVNYSLVHNEHTNRLFWRVDNQTLIGRFYLMHMIAIRPELRDFVIGSACDYSFIPPEQQCRNCNRFRRLSRCRASAEESRIQISQARPSEDCQACPHLKRVDECTASRKLRGNGGISRRRDPRVNRRCGCRGRPVSGGSQFKIEKDPEAVSKTSLLGRRRCRVQRSIRSVPDQR
jgi:hypothetical protein